MKAGRLKVKPGLRKTEDIFAQTALARLAREAYSDLK
jgi:hypothetical protein